jgi:glycosyltransferase involved in cell wall biosynthesis
MIGKGSEEDSLKTLIRELGLGEYFSFQPWTENVFKELEHMDIFVMPSTREGCPNILLEAMAVARPIVASDIPGINEIINDGQDGFLVDTGDPHKFAEKIISLCRNVENTILVGKNAYASVEAKFTIEKETEAFKSLYCR